MVGNTHDVGSAEEQQRHLDGENHEGGGMFGSLRKKLRDTKLHDVKVCLWPLRDTRGIGIESSGVERNGSSPTTLYLDWRRSPQAPRGQVREPDQCEPQARRRA